jgi:hypothetical protein
MAQLTQFGERFGGLTARPGWVWDPEVSEATEGESELESQPASQDRTPATSR